MFHVLTTVNLLLPHLVYRLYIVDMQYKCV